MGEARTEKAFEKYAWVIFLVIGIYFLIVGGLVAGLVARPQDEDVKAITGMTWDGVVSSAPNPAKLVTYEFQQKEFGTIFWAMSIIAIAAYPFRGGERWAWYYLWSAPVFFGVLGAFFGSQLGSGWAVAARIFFSDDSHLGARPTSAIQKVLPEK